MINKFLLGSISLFLLVCSVLLIQVAVDRHYDTKQEIILVQSDLFKDVSYIKLEELIKDDSVRPLFQKEDKVDLDFKIALFYSDLSIVILKRSATEKPLKRYVADLLKKSVDKWDELIKKDNSMLFFKNYYLKMYNESLKSITN